jgi:hypothetical protein
LDRFSPRLQILGRSLRVDHVEKYRLPKKLLEAEEEKGAPDLGAGHAYKDAELTNDYNIHQGQDVFAPVDQTNETKDSSSDERRHKRKEKHKKRKESRRKHDGRKGSKRDRRLDTDSDDSHRKKKRSRSEKKRKHRDRDEDSTKRSDRDGYR